jgi:hypothetical protein
MVGNAEAGSAANVLRRIEFDATLDDMVDTNIRLAGRTVVFQRQRRLYQWVTGSFLAAALIGSAVSLASVSLGSGALALILALGATLGGLVGRVSGRYFDWRVRRHYRRMLRDMLDGSGSARFELEVRREGVWTRCRDVETSYPWSRLKRVTDAADSIELWFDPGLVVVRNRVFATESDRRQFLAATQPFAQRA